MVAGDDASSPQESTRKCGKRDGEGDAWKVGGERKDVDGVATTLRGNKGRKRGKKGVEKRIGERCSGPQLCP